MVTRALRSKIAKLALATGGVLLSLGAAEVALRAAGKRTGSRLHQYATDCGACSRLYDLNPKVQGISAQGLRDREFSPTPNEGVFRVLVLGDSVPFGLGVSAQSATFPRVLERALRERHGEVEVLNAGVPGYTSYNELHYYLEKGRGFRPHLVLLSFCMNDVADPVLHWAASGVHISVPDAAIPNPEYHRGHALPLLAKKRRAPPLPTRILSHLALYRLADKALTRAPSVTVDAGGRTFPAQLVGEDTISMKVLDDYDSPEWVWLRSMYDQIAGAVRADGATLAIVVHPVAYQLDPDYPLHPERGFARYCGERKIPCLDLVPALREHRAEPLYVGKTSTYFDIWHYAARGHEVAGRAIADFFERERLIPPATVQK